MNVKVMTVVFSSLKITSDGGQGPGNSGGSATTMAPNKSHIKGELHNICQIESFFWFTLKSTLCIQVLSQTHAIGFCRRSAAFCHLYCAELKLTNIKYNLPSNPFSENENPSVDS
jgi:hypothetical protein